MLSEILRECVKTGFKMYLYREGEGDIYKTIEKVPLTILTPAE